MANLTKASEELFSRRSDECFSSLAELWEHCYEDQQNSRELWPTPDMLEPCADGRRLDLRVSGEGYRLNDWSFGQLCKMASVGKETVNRLTAETAGRVLTETLPRSGKPLQLYARDDSVRAVHGTSYTRLSNVDLLTMLREFAVDFVPAQEASGPEGTQRTGLYCGEQDMFCFLIDPTGWTDIGGESFAPGFFLWNSEVGRRSLGVQTFWFQSVCQNHIVWDAIEVVEFSRRHTANVHESVAEIRSIIERLVAKRDERRDGFARAIERAMGTRFADSGSEAIAMLRERGVKKRVAEEALEIARQRGALTVFALVDALTRVAGKIRNAGDRCEADVQAASLLTTIA